MNISFHNLEIIFLYSIDMSYLITSDSKDKFREKRGNPLWPNEIIDNFSKFRETNIKIKKNISFYQIFSEFKEPNIKVKKDISFYRMTQNARIEKYTFSDYFSNEHMPIKFEFIEEPTDISSNHILISKSIRLNKDGAISIRYKVIPKNEEFSLKVDQAIDEIYNIRHKIREKITTDINQFIKFWNKSYRNIHLNKISKDIIYNMYTYEIILFDYKTGKKQIPIKKMFEISNLDLGKRLIGFVRMDRPGVWDKYTEEFILNFCKKDIGNRIDEFWLIYYERFLRYHPNRKETIFEKWMEDVLLGIEILLHKKAILEYINQWSSNKLFNLESVTARVLNKEQNSKSITDLSNPINKDIAEINSMAKIISDPLLLERNIPHSFHGVKNGLDFFSGINRLLPQSPLHPK